MFSLSISFSVFLSILHTISSSCPSQHLSIPNGSFISLSTDQYQSNEDYPVKHTCNFSIIGTSDVIVTVATSLVFSHRQPKNNLEISILSTNRLFVVQREPKAYRKLSLPLVISIPMNLNFRSTITVTPITPCGGNSNSIRCGSVCETECESFVCIDPIYQCDGTRNCDSDENDCETQSNELSTPHSVYFIEYSRFSSSLIMLIGFFTLNGFFVVFFVFLSFGSASSCLPRTVFRARNKKSRVTFIQMIRDAEKKRREADGEVTVPPPSRPSSLPPPSRFPSASRQSLLARLSLQPILREHEPETEEIPSPCLHSLPSPTSSNRKGSMPELNPILPTLMLKRTSLQPNTSTTKWPL